MHRQSRLRHNMVFISLLKYAFSLSFNIWFGFISFSSKTILYNTGRNDLGINFKAFLNLSQSSEVEGVFNVRETSTYSRS